MKNMFNSKAETLHKLKNILQNAKIAPLIYFNIKQWKTEKKKWINNILELFGNVPLIVRSSCNLEDQKDSSNAGAFLSLLNVKSDKLSNAIESVIDSYGKENLQNKVLVQPMLENVIRSGVAFTHDPNTCSPYRLINWSYGKETNKVTEGSESLMWQQAAESPVEIPKIHISILALLDELLTIFDQTPIDCEFAVTLENNKEVLWLLQARPLILSSQPETKKQQTARLKKIYDKVDRGMRPHPFLMGKKTVYGVMPDWNPAEIVGIRPKPLAYSLYRELVTDSIWAYQRHNYGYRNLRSFPLMPHFYGLPYVDVRLSFNSFIPASLDKKIANRLVDYYIDCLLKEPSLHDKVEFEIVFSCYTLDLSKRLKALNSFGFTESEKENITGSLRDITNKILHPTHGLWISDSARIKYLNNRYEKVITSDMNEVERIYWLIEDTKRYGTLPFAGLARAGFIAVQLLQSLKAVGVFSQKDLDNFLVSVNTVNGQMARDRFKLNKSDFLKKYGHLRPGTYDILSPRYDEAPNLYFDWDQKPNLTNNIKIFYPNSDQMKKIDKLLKKHLIETDSVGLIDFMKKGIQLREMSKFHFTRSLSETINLIADLGKKYEFKREDLAYSSILAFKELYVGATDIKYIISRSIEEGKKNYSDTLKVSLPPLIVKSEDIWSFELPKTVPNFVTQKQVTAEVSHEFDLQKLSGTIVCIQKADPGYDWLFSFPIKGLITAWGGANSHMAIRAGELGLPAVIGAGEILYKRWSNAKSLHIDCASRKVEIIA